MPATFGSSRRSEFVTLLAIVSLAVVFTAAVAADGWAQSPGPDLNLLNVATLATPNKILTSYSGQIFYQGEGYIVTATVTKGLVSCQGTFTADKPYPISGRGRLELEMNVRKELDRKKGSKKDQFAEHQYRFTLHCPYPQDGGVHGATVQELAHSYEQPGGEVTFDPNTCDQLGGPVAGHAGPCGVVWPEKLSGAWSDTTGDATLYMSWALCQHVCAPPPKP